MQKDEQICDLKAFDHATFILVYDQDGLILRKTSPFAESTNISYELLVGLESGYDDQPHTLLDIFTGDGTADDSLFVIIQSLDGEDMEVHAA